MGLLHDSLFAASVEASMTLASRSKVVGIKIPLVIKGSTANTWSCRSPFSRQVSCTHFLMTNMLASVRRGKPNRPLPSRIMYQQNRVRHMGSPLAPHVPSASPPICRGTSRLPPSATVSSPSTPRMNLLISPSSSGVTAALGIKGMTSVRHHRTDSMYAVKPSLAAA